MNLFSPEALTALATLSAMEIVLGIDNIVFIAILTGRLPQEQQAKIRNLGISLALILRLGLLFSISWIMQLTAPLFEVFGFEVSGRSIILLSGGLFLIAKATFEIHHKIEEAGVQEKTLSNVAKKAAAMVLFQILLLDIVFSLDSVITAVGMANQVSIMVIAMTLAMFVMLLSAKSVGDFVERHPTVKILALSFLILIGVMLVAEGMGNPMPKAYVYFAMAFSLSVEMINMRYRLAREKKAQRS